MAQVRIPMGAIKERRLRDRGANETETTGPSLAGWAWRGAKGPISVRGKRREPFVCRVRSFDEVANRYSSWHGGQAGKKAHCVRSCVRLYVCRDVVARVQDHRFG